jgi:hypothetical protein
LYYLALFAVIISSVIVPSYAIPYFSEQERVNIADAIGYGSVLSYHDEGASRIYEISILRWLKNPQTEFPLVVKGVNEKGFHLMAPIKIFQKDDLGIFYLRKIDDSWQTTFFSKQVYYDDVPKEIKEIKSLLGREGAESAVSLDISCKDSSHVNLVKNRTGKLVCVLPETKEILIARGWGATRI